MGIKTCDKREDSHFRTPDESLKSRVPRPRTQDRSCRRTRRARSYASNSWSGVNYNRVVPVLHNLRITLEMIKWEHSIFALPFALCGAMLAAGGIPTLHQLVWIVVAMVAARSAAMSFNRLADAQLDAANPRTRTRALPAGALTSAFVRNFVLVSAAVFLLAAWGLNRTAFLLSPLSLAVLLLYSYTKRWTRWSHLILGLALGIAPAAAWIAV